MRGVARPTTRARCREKETEILARLRARPAGNFAGGGPLRVTSWITGYERRRIHGQDLLGSEPLDLPPTRSSPSGIWLEIPREIPAALERERHPMGGIHAVEHAALSLFPLFALCDRHDVAGITTRATRRSVAPRSSCTTRTPAGRDRREPVRPRRVAARADARADRGLPVRDGLSRLRALAEVRQRQPADRQGRRGAALALLLGHEPLPCCQRRPTRRTRLRRRRAAAATPARAPRLVYFDIETQRSAEEVGGWHNAHLMRVALAAIYDARPAASRPSTKRRADLLARLPRPTSWSASTSALRLRGAARLHRRRPGCAADLRPARRHAPGSASACRSAISPRRRSARARAATDCSRSRGGGKAARAT